jgi:phosphoglycolate phosphatase
MSPKEYLKGIKLFIFDYDGVIYNMIEPLREMVLEGIPKYQLKSNGLQEDMQEIFRVLEFALARSVADQILNAKQMLDIKLLEGMPILKRLRIATWFYGDFRARTKNPQLFDGIEELIKGLHKKGIKLAIFSNSTKAYILETLTKYHLEGYFSIILGATEVQNVKPHPEGLLKILNDTRYRAEDTLYIGDMLTDFEAGTRANIRTILVASGIIAREKLAAANPFILVDDIRQLNQMLL